MSKNYKGKQRRASPAVVERAKLQRRVAALEAEMAWVETSLDSLFDFVVDLGYEDVLRKMTELKLADDEDIPDSRPASASSAA